MPCFVSDKKTDGFECQFKIDENEIIEFENRKWCIFHLPCNENGQKVLGKDKEAEEAFLKFEKHYRDNNLSEDYRYSIFSQSLFRGKDYHQGIDLSNTIFSGEACFNNCTFLKHVNFNGAKFKKKSEFKDCNFTYKTDVNFSGAIFENNTSFYLSKCHTSIDFSKSTFKGSLDFHSTECSENVNFSSCLFFSNANFKTEFNSGSRYDFKGEVNFSDAKFHDHVNFSNRIFNNKTNFAKCIFYKVPVFHGCQLHQDTIFPDYKYFKDTKSEGASRSYRTLSLAMAYFKARKEEAMFYALEQKSLRKNLGIFDTAFSWCYDVFSGYGQSLPKILGSILIFFAIFCLSYALWFTPLYNVKPSNNIDWQILKESVGYTIQQIIRPFSVWASGFPINSNVHWFLTFKIISLIQTLVFWIFITLLIFTVRWKFKRE